MIRSLGFARKFEPIYNAVIPIVFAWSAVTGFRDLFRQIPLTAGGWFLLTVSILGLWASALVYVANFNKKRIAKDGTAQPQKKYGVLAGFLAKTLLAATILAATFVAVLAGLAWWLR